MRSPHPPDERDLDVAGLRRSPTQTGAARKGHGGGRGRTGVRRYVVGGIVALVLALFSGVIWFAYQDLMPGGDEAPPLIRADANPIKHQPDERGGLPLVNEESAVVRALDEPDSPVRVERIVPRESTAPRSTADVIPEPLEAEPRSDTDLAIAVPTTGPGVAAVDGPGDSLDMLLAEIVDGQADVAPIEPAAGPGPADFAAESADVDALPLPADGITLPEREVAALESQVGQAPLPAASVPTPSTPAASAPAAPAPPTAAATPAPALTPPPPPAPPPAAAAPAPTPPAPVAAPVETRVAALPSPALAPDFQGAYGVQLLAVRDEAAAAGAWSGLQQQHPTVLGPLRSRVQRAVIGGNTFYRLQAGPFADRAGASAVCSALQARGTDCFIVEPTS